MSACTLPVVIPAPPHSSQPVDPGPLERWGQEEGWREGRRYLPLRSTHHAAGPQARGWATPTSALGTGPLHASWWSFSAQPLPLVPPCRDGSASYFSSFVFTAPPLLSAALGSLLSWMWALATAPEWTGQPPAQTLISPGRHALLPGSSFPARLRGLLPHSLFHGQ